MNIGLAYTNDDAHKLHKNLTVLGGYTGSLRGEMSVLNPVVQVQVPEGTAARANYASMVDIEERSNYYFIKDVVFIRSGVCELHLELDPLMTYETEIKNLICTVEKNEKLSNSYLVDNEYRILAYENIVTKTFPSGFDDESMILFAVG